MPVKVSVIVPVYNVEEYLEGCLASLTRQTLSALEIIVVNDGSTDGSQRIIDAFAAKYPDKLRAFKKENGGLSDARNFGVAQAAGEYLAFVDADDWADPGMFSQMYEKAAEDGADIVTTPLSYVYPRRVNKHYYDDIDRFGAPVTQTPDILYWASSFACNKIFRRGFFLENGFRFPAGQWFEDSALIYNVMLKANRISAVNTPFYHYRCEREGAITRTLNDKIFDIFRSCESIIAFYRENGAYDLLRGHIGTVCVKHIYMRVKALFRCDDKKLIRRFAGEAFSFLDRNFPGWRGCEHFAKMQRGRKERLRRYVLTHKAVLKTYLCLPRGLRKFMKKAYSRLAVRLWRLRGSAAREAQAARENEQKRRRIQKDGLALLVQASRILDSAGAVGFADFGTLLGIVREGRLLSHDLDIDIGVLPGGAQLSDIRVAFENAGFSLWRQYVYKKRVVEESYRFGGVKIDLNYYESSDDRAKTWLFYRRPGKIYRGNTRDVVEMTYSPVCAVEKRGAGGQEINVPQNAEALLGEKYGPSWRVPDEKWIYWESPAAKKLPHTGYYVEYRYIHRPPDEKTARREQKQMKKLQSCELKVLLEVARVCDGLGLKYYLGEGTLLGAVRHGGFIPWDDDVDILMPRADYDAFLELAPAQLGPDFEVQHFTRTRRYWSVFMKVRYTGETPFYQEPIEHLTRQTGPYIDIFPLDEVPEAYSKGQRRQKIIFGRLRKALSYKMGDTRPKARVVRRSLLKLAAKLTPAPLLYKMVDLTYRRYGTGHKHYVNLASYYGVKKQTFPKEYYGDGRMQAFEGHSLRIPREAEKILETVYGDYMRLPPMSGRKLKHSFSVRSGGAEKR